MAASTGRQLDAWLGQRGLRLETREGRGRCLVAARAFAEGALLLEQQPYAWASLGLACADCGLSSDSLKRCAACAAVFFCNAACQRASWTAGHSRECPALSRLRKECSRTPPASLRLAHRVLLRRERECAAPDTSPALLSALLSHRAEAAEEQLVSAAQMAHLLVSYASVPPRTEEDESAAPVEPWRLSFTASEATELLLALSCNAHSVCDDELRPIGRGLYPLLACANHDCAPSCVLTFRGAAAQLRASRPLQAGDELTLSYIDLLAPASERIAELQAGYFFRCTCSRCAAAGSKEDALLGCGEAPPERVAALAAALAEAKACRAGTPSAHRAAAERALRLADEQPRLPPSSAMRARALDECMRAAVEGGRYREALRFALGTLPGYEAAYGSACGGKHPLLGLQWAAVAKLIGAAQNEEEEAGGRGLQLSGEGEAALQRALSILRVTHGGDSALVRQLDALLVETRMGAVHAQAQRREEAADASARAKARLLTQD